MNFSTLQLEKKIPSKIHIGDEWIYVPFGYIHLESEFTGENSIPIENYTDELRQYILDKRVEFYEVYKVYCNWVEWLDE